MAQPVRPGFFGKLPSRGDFVVRRLPADFVAHWDEWLQAALAHSREALAERWLDTYLTSPIWRFALSPGFCGADAYCGVLVPSVDRAGRYFPLLAATACSPTRALPLLARALDSWYASVEDLLLETLADTPLELDEFDARLAALAPPDAHIDVVYSDWRLSSAGANGRWHCAVPQDLCIGDSLGTLFGALLANEWQRYGIWWTQGSARVEAGVAVTDRFPSPAAYTAMLDGRWREHWATARLATAEGATARADEIVCRSAAITDVGNERDANEDSFACHDELGVWVVADGLGGHLAGGVASRMVTSVVAELDAAATLRERAAECSRALRVVNGCLQVLGESNAVHDVIGTTVAVLLVSDGGSACLWAGDSRIYRLRAGVLTQLTRDHSAADAGEPSRHYVTRAVGGPGELLLELEHGHVDAGDRYLLCTDGLYGELAAEQISRALARDTPEAGCTELRDAALLGAARDNLTGIIVHVSTRPEPAR